MLDTLAGIARTGGERRTAILATMAFIRDGDVMTMYRIAEVLLEMTRTSSTRRSAWRLRAAGDRDPAALRAFLDRHSATMPRTTLCYALEHFDDDERAQYMGSRKC